MNPGNAGHRYRMPKIISVRDKDRHVVLDFACGHEKVIGVNDGYSWDARGFWHGQVGQRERCYDCKGSIGPFDQKRVPGMVG